MNGVDIYFIIINVVAFFMYGLDKYKAKHNQWRIPERALLGVAVFGGTLGAIAGMNFFHHKTKHAYFRYGLPAMLVVQILLIVWVFGT